MSTLLTQSSTGRPLMFFMTDAADHIAGKTGLTPTVVISKAGGSFATPAGAVSEVGNGWYKVAGHATDTSALGPLVLHATATGADPVDKEWDVVVFNPHDGTRLGLSALPNAAAEASGGLITRGTGTGQLSVSSGRANADVTHIATAAVSTSTAQLGVNVVSTSANAISATSLATDTITAAKVAVDAVTEIQSGLATAANLATVAGYIDTEVAAIKAKTDQLVFASGRVEAVLGSVDEVSDSSFREAVLAYISGKSTVVDNEDGTNTITYTKRNGTTGKLAITYDVETGEWPVVAEIDPS